MKKLLLVMFFTAMGMFKGQSQALVQTYVDRCTGAVNVFSVPMNGQTVVAFYNRSKVFTSQDFQNGTLQAWLEETYLWWTALSPCSTTTTGAQATQQTTQQTTQQATQAATNAAAQAASTSTPAVPATPAPTTPTTNAPPTTTSPPPTTEAPQTTSPDTSTANPTTSTESQPTGGTDNTSTGTDNSTSGTNQESTTETQSSSEQTDTSSTETTESTNESTEASTSEETSTEDSSTETSSEDTSTEETSTDESTETETEEVEETSTEESTEESNESETEESTEESTEEETTEEETTEEESTEEESTEEESENEESDEESSEEESDEESEEDTEEESDEEESDDDESEEDEEEDTEEESKDEDEEEDDKKKKKRRNLAPPIITANAMSQQMPTGEFQQAVTVGISRSSLMGTETYGVNAMVYDNLQQFMLNVNYSKVHINKEGRVNRVYSASLGGMKMFSTYMAMMNHSLTFLGKKGSVAGVAFGTSITTNEVDILDGLLYFDNQFLGLSLTGFFTRSLQVSPKLSISPMLAVSSPFLMLDMYKHTTMWSTDVMVIGGSNFSYKLTQRFGLNLGVNIIESTAKDFPTMKAFTIGGRLSF